MKFGMREILFVVLLLAIPLAAWWLVFRPNTEQKKEMLADIENRRAKLLQLNQATGAIGDLQKEIVSLEEAMDLFQSKLPNEKEIDKVLQGIWRLAEANDLITKSIRTSGRGRHSGRNQIQTGPHAEQPISIELIGDFRGFYKFLMALETQPRIMRVTQMRLQKLAKEAPEGYMKATFDMSIFFEKNGKDKA